MPLKRCGSVRARLSAYVVATAEDSEEFVEGRREQFQAAGVVQASRPSRPRIRKSEGAMLGAGLGEQEAPPGEVERRQARAARELDSRRLPVESAGDHQMQDEPEIVIEPEDDSLPQSPRLADGLAVGLVQGRVERPQQERAADAHAVQALADDATVEGLDIDGDIRQLGHEDGAPRRGPNRTRSPRLAFFIGANNRRIGGELRRAGSATEVAPAARKRLADLGGGAARGDEMTGGGSSPGY